MDTGFHVGRRGETDILDEVKQRLFDTLLVGQLTLPVHPFIGFFHRQAGRRQVQGMFCLGPAHCTVTPLRVKMAPVTPRQLQIKKACISLLKGNHTINSSTLRMWIASRVS